MKITILVDNYLTQPSSLRMRLLGEWGFAAYVHGYRILYDTELSGATLLNNMKALGVSLDEPEVLVFIHRHMDHTGGLRPFLSARTRPVKIVVHVNLFVKAYVGDDRGEVEIGVDFTREHIESRGAELVLESRTKSQRGVWDSGEIPRRWAPYIQALPRTSARRHGALLEAPPEASWP
jgi:7,8-dihydropterin-6-yl-methyl-4-(beta-D-ribofuranosyl)aminobenzene 5'-phosphate synthase